MNVKVLNLDNTVSEIGGVRWHPAYARHDITGDTAYPAGMWIRKSDVVEHYSKINEFRKTAGILERDLAFVVDGIVCGEAPFEIYDDDTNEEPWRHFGTLARSVPACPDLSRPNERK